MDHTPNNNPKTYKQYNDKYYSHVPIGRLKNIPKNFIPILCEYLKYTYLWVNEFKNDLKNINSWNQRKHVLQIVHNYKRPKNPFTPFVGIAIIIIIFLILSFIFLIFSPRQDNFIMIALFIFTLGIVSGFVYKIFLYFVSLIPKSAILGSLLSKTIFIVSILLSIILHTSPTRYFTSFIKKIIFFYSYSESLNPIIDITFYLACAVFILLSLENNRVVNKLSYKLSIYGEKYKETLEYKKYTNTQKYGMREVLKQVFWEDRGIINNLMQSESQNNQCISNPVVENMKQRCKNNNREK